MEEEGNQHFGDALRKSVLRVEECAKTIPIPRIRNIPAGPGGRAGGTIKKFSRQQNGSRRMKWKGEANGGEPNCGPSTQPIQLLDRHIYKKPSVTINLFFPNLASDLLNQPNPKLRNDVPLISSLPLATCSMVMDRGFEALKLEESGHPGHVVSPKWL